MSATAGLSWKGSNASVSGLVGWHTGWPRTPLDFSPLQVGSRNSARWGDFISVDLRGSWIWTYDNGDLTAVVDVTNATNRSNPCCVVLDMEESSALTTETNSWLPALINIGFTYRWRSR